MRMGVGVAGGRLASRIWNVGIVDTEVVLLDITVLLGKYNSGRVGLLDANSVRVSLMARHHSGYL